MKFLKECSQFLRPVSGEYHSAWDQWLEQATMTKATLSASSKTLRDSQSAGMRPTSTASITAGLPQGGGSWYSGQWRETPLVWERSLWITVCLPSLHASNFYPRNKNACVWLYCHMAIHYGTTMFIACYNKYPGLMLKAICIIFWLIYYLFSRHFM